MTTPQTQAVQKADKEVSFVPFGAADAIKLSAKMVQSYLCTPTRAGHLCSEREAIRFVMLCQAQRLNPFQGDAYVVGYDSKDGPQFSLITAHQAFLKRAETCTDFEGMESGVILVDDDTKVVTEREGDFCLDSEKVVGGWAKVYRRGRKVTYRRAAMRRFAKGFGVWQANPETMIVKVAEADALRSTFPTLLGGLHMEGEIIDIQTNARPADLPTPKLVEVRSESSEPPRTDLAGGEVDAGETGTRSQTPSPSAAPAAGPAESSEVEKLRLLVTGEGYSFDEFVKWAINSGQVPDADSLPEWSALSEKVAKRLVTAKAGLLRGLALMKGGAA
jgi:phage recombination protein Bet